mmetsp:Transcript_17104/g.51043  ORF Transcript_17104/g.51043 Transcript_17104/m.51043 type:complete len:207 (-) Transcript_17104:26-646(-)
MAAEPSWGSGAGNPSEFDDIVFDFEPFLPDLLPPLSITGHHQSQEARRQAIEAAAVSAPVGMSHQKLAEKYRTVVCRHWLRGLCMKGDNCEFLHQFDAERMPVCRWGDQCRIKDCPYKHEKEEDKPQCVFYQQGFCLHGPECRYRHWKQAASKRPLIADFSLGIAQGRNFLETAMQRKRPAEERRAPNGGMPLNTFPRQQWGGMGA